MGDIKKNQKVNLVLNLDDGSEKIIETTVREVFSDRIELNKNSDTVAFERYLDEGEELLTKIFTPVGVKIFNTIILDSPSDSDFMIEYAEVTAEIQRREYVRVPYEIKIVIKRDSAIQRDCIVTNTIDISGGGLRFTYNGMFQPSEIVELTLYLPDEKFIQIKARIVTNKNLPSNVHTLHFIEIKENDRDRIVKACFDKQAKLIDI